MAFQFICPYCFRSTTDEKVCFRSEKVNRGMNEAIPEEYDDIEDFKARYRGADKEQILRRIADWEFFAEGMDEAYERFWEHYQGTTEKNPAEKFLGKAYLRKVINPSLAQHAAYLKQQKDGSYFIRDAQGMVTSIELTTGEVCSRRVCPHCHNPLPDNYGKNPVKFASVIGITGAGKTIYLRQLLFRMQTYATKVGLTAIVNDAGVGVFLENNRIAPGEPLPGSTPANRLQQPLFYELVRSDGQNGKITETFVLYDVAGEVFDNAELVEAFAPFIKHSDGLVLLIDPMQFQVVSGSVAKGRQLSDPATALNVIHNIISERADMKCDTPIAVCISKVDTAEVQEVLDRDLAARLLQDVSPVKAQGSRFNATQFNAREYNPIVRKLDDFFINNEMALAQQLEINYSNYSYFAFTSLGCDVLQSTLGSGQEYQYPEGPIVPKRVEEPILWLFNRLGYIGQNETLYQPGQEIVSCPNCGRDDLTHELPEGSVDYIRRGLFKRSVPVNYQCDACGYRWWHIPGED